MSFLELDKLSKTFVGGTAAVRGIDLGIPEGEFVVLLGPSGCGKTTTLRMIAGLERPTSGAIRLAGRDVTRLRPSQRDVGFVFQFYALYPHLSVEENVSFPLECAGMNRSERERSVAAVLARLGLDGLREKLPRELSGGDQQRVALARAMVRSPRLFLMDEPLGTLDTDLRLTMCEFLRARQLELRVTTVYVTHDQEEALRLADRIVVMSEGCILQADSPSVVYDDPADLFVARFVGSPGMNLIAGEVREDRTRCAFHPKPPPSPGMLAKTVGGVDGCTSSPKNGPSLPLHLPVRPGAAVLGIRPEFLRLDPRGPIRGRALLEEYLGASRCIHLDTTVGRLVVRLPASASVPAGEELELALDPHHVRLFDPASGARLA